MRLAAQRELPGIVGAGADAGPRVERGKLFIVKGVGSVHGQAECRSGGKENSGVRGEKALKFLRVLEFSYRFLHLSGARPTDRRSPACEVSFPGVSARRFSEVQGKAG